MAFHPRTGSQTLQKTVTIGIPVFNGELYLQEAINSVLRQTYTNFEIVISDNASTDSTEMLCREYAYSDTRVRYIRHPENRGATNNFLSALEEARGEYFAWFAADDIWKEDTYLADLVSALEDGAQLAFPDVELIALDDAGKPIVLRRNVMAPFAGCDSKFDYCRASILLCSHQFYSLFRTVALRASLPFLENATSEGFFVQAVTATLTSKFVQSATAIYRIHDSSETGRSAPFVLFKNHLPYTAKCAAFWLRQRQLTWLERARIILALVLYNGYYAVRLLGVTFFRKVTGSRGRRPLKRFGVPLRTDTD